MTTNISIFNSEHIDNIDYTVYELFEKYRGHSNLLNYHPITEYNDYYIIAHPIKGLIASKCFADYEPILNYKKEEILAMKIHKSILEYHNFKNEEEVAIYLHEILHI